ncbi:MAG: methyltransferase [Lysobacteraceae bacterium]
MSRRPPLPEMQPLLETLLLPIASGAVPWPSDHPVVFLGAREGAALQRLNLQYLLCEQDFKPWADELQVSGLRVVNFETDEHVEGSVLAAQMPAAAALVLVLPPRQRDQARTLLARASVLAGAGGLVVAAMRNAEGARSGESDFARLLGPPTTVSKHKARVYWMRVDEASLDRDLQLQWLGSDAVRPIAGGRFLSRPGLFAWDRVDAASALLAAQLPTDLHGRGADLGAGYGYLAAEVLARNPQVTALDLYEADQRALELARANLARLYPDSTAQLNFHWHDVTRGLLGSYDFIVSNPPFHQGRADAPELGRSFIAAAADALVENGSLWLVANRHLAYENILDARFASVRALVQRDGFKVIEARDKRKQVLQR